MRGNNTPLIIAGGGGGIRVLTKIHAEYNANTNKSGNTGYSITYPIMSAGGENGQGGRAPSHGNAGENLI